MLVNRRRHQLVGDMRLNPIRLPLLLILILTTLPTIASTASEEQMMGPSPPTLKIINGEESRANSHPYLVSLTKQGQHKCGGSVRTIIIVCL